MMPVRRDFIKVLGLAAACTVFPCALAGPASAAQKKTDTAKAGDPPRAGHVEIIRIDEGTWRFQEDMVRCFLLTGTREALLIDSGNTIHNAKELAQGLTDLPIKLLNTHADRDHIGSNHEFPSFYMSMAEASNYYHGPDRRGEIIPIEHGDTLDLGGRELRIIALPGHTPGSIAVLDVSRRVLISGDPIQDGDVFMFGVQRELHAYVLSLKRLEKYRSQFDLIYPAHGSFPVSPDLIPKLYGGVEKILRGEIQGQTMTRFGRTIKRYDIGVAGILGEAD